MKDLSFVHPASHMPLIAQEGGFCCLATGEVFPHQNGVPCFLPESSRSAAEDERSDFVNAVKTLLRRFPRTYVWLIYLISPVCYVGMTAQKFLKRFQGEAKILNVGSGVHRYKGNILNLDMYPYKEVDIVGDATALPFADDTFEGALCECLLEHVTEPQKVVREILRVLKPGGQAFLTIPFVYAFHACPHDYYRWSIMGMRELCREGRIIEVKSRSGPTSALVSTFVTWLAITFSFGSEAVYNVLSMVLLIPIAPFKFFDKLVGRFPTALHGTEGFYAIIAKPNV